MKEVITLGEILVEIMAKNTDQTFLDAGEFLGPFPSGAPAIFINQVAKMGVPCAILGSVGDDDFGAVCLNRLNENGVSTRLINKSASHPTGTAFVRYQSDGNRDFIFNIRHSAAAEIALTEAVKQSLADCAVFHVMGSSIFSHELVDLMREAIQIVKAHGGMISFDPNVRKELLSDSGLFAFFEDVLKVTDIFMPSGDELFAMTHTDSIDQAIPVLLANGTSEIVIKNGGDGCALYLADKSFSLAAFPVEEVDATGAGDTFGATYIAARQSGRSPEAALRLANASGALAVSAWGPMEGASTEQEIQQFITSSHQG